MALFHFLFEIAKIAVLASVYAGVLFLLLTTIARILKFNIKRPKFLTLYCFVALVLFVFMFTYYGNHGLGDESRVPLANGESVNASDGYTYFKLPGKFEQIRIGVFSSSDNGICAKTDSGFVYYNFKSKQLSKFKQEIAYTSFAAQHNLPLPEEFEQFDKHYDRYWNGWRFWLLP